MAVAAQLTAKVSVDGVDKAKTDLQGMGKAVGETSGGFKSMLGNALSFAGGQAVFSLVGKSVGFLKDQLADCLKESMDAQAGMADTVNVLRSTHDASGMTAQAVADLATKYSHLTKFSDDTIQSGENMLLTFTNIGKNVFPQATVAMLDLSQKMKGDTQGAAIQLGKALNDPIAGITALSRVGVTFTQQQKDVIKKLMDTGDIAGAQKVILKELGTEFGGAAVAAGKTFGGQLTILKQNLADVKQNIGDALLPVLTNLMNFVSSSVMPGLAKFGGIIASMIGPAVASVTPIIKTLVTDFQNLFKNVNPGAMAGMTDGFKQFLPVLTTVGNLLKGELVHEFQQFGIMAQQVGQWFMTSVVPALRQAEPGFANLAKTILTTVIPAMIQIRAVVMDVIEHAFKIFGPIIEKIIPPLIVFAGQLANGIGGALKFIMPYVLQATKAIGQFADEIMTRVAPIIKTWIAQTTSSIQQFSALWAVIWPSVSRVLQGAWNEIVGVVKVAWAIVSGIIKIGLDAMSGNWTGVWNDVKDMLSGVWDGIQQIVNGGIQMVIGFIDGVWSGISGQISAPFEAAWNTISGIFANISGAISGAIGSVGDIGGALHNAHIPGFASGTSSAPGGMAVVGERGPEIMYVPRGAHIIPNSQLSSGGGSGQQIVVQPAPVYLDGRLLMSGLMPYFADSVRYGTGTRGF